MVSIYNGILLNHKKDWNKAIWSNMDGPKDYHSKWSESEKDKYNMISFTCGIKKWCKWTYEKNRLRRRKQTGLSKGKVEKG